MFLVHPFAVKLAERNIRLRVMVSEWRSRTVEVLREPGSRTQLKTVDKIVPPTPAAPLVPKGGRLSVFVL